MSFDARTWRKLSVLAGALAAGAAGAQAQAAIAVPAGSSVEFGIVVALGKTTVTVRETGVGGADLQHSFRLTGDTRADVVRLGDAVEVIFVANGPDRMLQRLVYLRAGLPAAGSGARVVPVAPPAMPASGKAQRGTQPVDLSGKTDAKVPVAKAVPLGASPDSLKKLQAPKTKDIARDNPSEECNRSDADWPKQPIRLAVLDFRYPTEHEESHDVGLTGGGSGTAVADLVYDQLDGSQEFALSRGDRQRLYRGDFAGAARIGRALGVDAVLAGAFAPVGATSEDLGGPKAWELSAGLVDTCTGQLLMRLSSVACAGGLDPGPTGSAAGCNRYAVTAKEAADPKGSAAAFKLPIEALLAPLQHQGTPAGQAGSAGTVSAADGGSVTIRLPTGTALKPGDQVAVHASRLVKNAQTFTLHRLQDEEIGRVTIRTVQGGLAVGTFQGDYPVKVGDTAELVHEQQQPPAQ